MITSTLPSKVVVNWYKEKELMTDKGESIPYLVIPSDYDTFLGIPLLPVAEPDFTCSFYLFSTYTPGQVISKQFIERGELHLKLTLKLPQETATEPVFFHKAQIRLINNRLRGVLGVSLLKAGVNPSFTLSAVLDPDSCDQFHRIIRDQSSALHLSVTITFYVKELNQFKSIESVQPLSKVVRLIGLIKEELSGKIKIKYFDHASSRYIPVPELFQTDPLKKKKRGIKSPEMFIANKGIVATNHATLQPASTLAATSLVNSPILSSSAIALHKLDDITFVEVPQTLPLVEDEQQRWFPDLTNSTTYWAVPVFELMVPNLTDDPTVSPFRFLFRTIGMDQEGKPVLEGEVTFTLRFFLSEEIKKEILNTNSRANIKLIDTNNISISIEIPFIQGNQLITSTLITEEFIRKQDCLMATFRMSNDWIRICYGVLSALNPVSEKKLKINLAYSFTGMSKKVDKFDSLIFNQQIFKIAALPVLTKSLIAQQNITNQPPALSYFNASEKRLSLANGQSIYFNDFQKPREKSDKLTGRLSTMALSKINEPAIYKETLLPIANSQKIDKINKHTKYIKQSFLRKDKLEGSFECTKFGDFYQEENSDGTIASIGCKEPYKLGELRFSLYVPLTEISDPDFKVYRSTQIPNRFLIVPRRFVITRFEPDRRTLAFSPCLRLYSTIDAVNLERSRCVLDCTLAPDIDRFKLEDLHFRLSQFTSYTPYVSFPGEIEHTEVYQWGIPANLTESIETFSLGAYIRMVLGAKIEGVLTLHSLLKTVGLPGKVIFTLPDASTFEAELMISLESIKGPFINGALIKEKLDSTLSLKNGLNQRLQLTEIHTYNNYEDKIVMPVEKSLEGGEAFSMSIDPKRIHVPHYTVDIVPEDLSETRQYLEDIECQVIFVTAIDFAALGIKNLNIQFGLSAQSLHETKLNKDKTVAEEMIIMPLTHFFDQREIQYFISVEKENGEVLQATWKTVSLIEGNIINITTSLIQTS